jgi:hypothetical protein
MLHGIPIEILDRSSPLNPSDNFIPQDKFLASALITTNLQTNSYPLLSIKIERYDYPALISGLSTKTFDGLRGFYVSFLRLQA